MCPVPVGAMATPADSPPVRALSAVQRLPSEEPFGPPAIARDTTAWARAGDLNRSAEMRPLVRICSVTHARLAGRWVSEELLWHMSPAVSTFCV